MTMHPDNHAPHPCRRFDDEEIYMPPKPSRISALPVKPRPARPSRASLWLAAVRDVMALLFTAVAFVFAGLIFFGTDAQIAAWGLWFRNLIGG
jgi:hypothetical protein